MQYLPKPRAATSVATNIDTFPLRNSETEQYHGKIGCNKKYEAGYRPYLYIIVTSML
jgi:hypothetical protein